jgi:alpha-beta hydrolase superfamily lysophospholipase
MIKAKSKHDFFKTSDNISLHFKITPAASPKASVIFVHGVGEHISRYDSVFNAFANQGYSCFGFDQRGFGLSGGERGHMDLFSEYVEDLAKFIDEIVPKNTETPVFLFGHSMGSIVVLSYALRYAQTHQGLLIFSCPLILDSWLANMGGYVAIALSAIAPRLKFSTLINPMDLSDDPSIIKEFVNDPLIVSKVSINWLREFKLARENILLNAEKINIPTLICHGKEDRIAAIKGSKLLYEKLGGDDKSLIVYDALKHELLNHRPIERLNVLTQTLGWLDRHCT